MDFGKLFAILRTMASQVMLWAPKQARSSAFPAAHVQNGSTSFELCDHGTAFQEWQQLGDELLLVLLIRQLALAT